MKECLITIKLGLAITDLVDALARKRKEGDIGFLCPGCHKPVKAHKDGIKGPHFEHIKANPNNSLSGV
jgi:competence CoiA-like predicted nuclease